MGHFRITDLNGLPVSQLLVGLLAYSSPRSSKYWTYMYVSNYYRVFGLNLTVSVFFTISDISRRKKEIFTKIKIC